MSPAHYELVLDIPKVLWHTSNTERGHWARWAPAKRTIRAIARSEAYRTRLPHSDRARVIAYIGYPTNRGQDPGNASPVVKAALDGLTDAGAWPDDSSAHVVGPDYRIGPYTGITRLYTVTLHITPLPKDQP